MPTYQSPWDASVGAGFTLVYDLDWTAQAAHDFLTTATKSITPEVGNAADYTAPAPGTTQSSVFEIINGTGLQIEIPSSGNSRNSSRPYGAGAPPWIEAVIQDMIGAYTKTDTWIFQQYFSNTATSENAGSGPTISASDPSVTRYDLTITSGTGFNMHRQVNSGGYIVTGAASSVTDASAGCLVEMEVRGFKGGEIVVSSMQAPSGLQMPRSGTVNLTNNLQDLPPAGTEYYNGTTDKFGFWSYWWASGTAAGAKTTLTRTALRTRSEA